MGLPTISTAHQIDLPQAHRLSSLISTALARLSSSDADAHISNEKAELEAREAALTIASASAQLAALVRPPEQVLLEVATGFTLSAALRLTVEAHIPEIIRTLSLSSKSKYKFDSRSPIPNGQLEASADKDSAIDVGDDGRYNSRHPHDEVEGEEEEGVSVGEIARLSGVNVDKLDRILRLLATHHIFAERPPLPIPSNPDPSNPNPNSRLREQSGEQQVGEEEEEEEEAEAGVEGQGQPQARFAHTRLSAALDSGAALADVLNPDLIPLPLPLPLSEEEKEVTRKEEEEERGGNGGNGGSGESENGEEKRRKRWAAKYGAEAPGAGLAALVGLLTDDSMFNATALTDVLLYSKTEKTEKSSRSKSGDGDAKIGEEKREEVESASISVPALRIDSSAPAPAPAPAPASSESSDSPSSPSSPPPPADSHPPPPNADSDTKEDENDNDNDNDNDNEDKDKDEDEDSPLRAAFSHAHSLPHTTMFEWLSAPGNAHKLHRFGCAMRGMGSLTPESAILRGFDFASLPPGSTVVDVGGGVGTASLPILRACPQLKLVVQDTEEVVRVAPGFWEKQYPEALEAGRVSFQVQSFFDAQPRFSSPTSTSSLTIENGEGGKEQGGKEQGGKELGGKEQGPAAFLLRMIMHNWPDAHCERILARLRAAAGAGTRLVLVDSILMAACRERRVGSKYSDENDGVDGEEGGVAGEEGEGGEGGVERWEEAKVKEAPEPLLANWGTANGLAYRLDLIMLANHNARERTLAAFATLLAKTGWTITEVHAASESWMPQIVAVPTTIPASTSTPNSISVVQNGAGAEAQEQNAVSTEKKQKEEVVRPLEPELKADVDAEEEVREGAKVRVGKRFSLSLAKKGEKGGEKEKEKGRKRKSVDGSWWRGSGQKEKEKEKEKEKKKRFGFLRGILSIRSH